MSVTRTAARTLTGALSAARRRTSGDDGVTLIEVVVASVLLGVLAAAILGIIMQTQSAQVGNRARIAAANLAAREIDFVREEFGASDEGPLDLAAAGTVTNPHPLDGGTPGDPLVLDGVPYSVVRSAAWNPTAHGESACEGGTLVAYPTLTVTVSVTWPNMGPIQPVVSDALFAPDKGNGVPGTSSFVAVSVVDAAGQPNAGRSVRVVSGGAVHPGLTDPSGCAVVRVDPAVGAGTDYIVSMADVGYVDISGNPSPSKATGPILRGTLNNSVSFAYERAGSVELRVYDPAGATLTDDEVSGAQVTLVASEYAGASGATVHTLTGVTQTISNLWPTIYGGYFGTVAPAGGYPSVEVTPGATVTLDVPFAPAEVPFTNLPAGTSAIVAVPAGSGLTCGSAGAKTFPASAPDTTISLLPGTWQFFVVGSTFSCSSGDPTGTEFGSGLSEAVAWDQSSTLRVTGAVPGGTLWAVDAGLTGPLSTCPGAAAAPIARNVDGARTGPVGLLPGTWYLYVTDGAPDGACQGFLAGGQNPATVSFGQAKSVAWALNSAAVTITGIENAGSRRPYVYLSTSTASLSCTSSGLTSAGTVASWGRPASEGASLNGVVPQGTWYVYGNDQASSATWSPRCRLAGTIIVGPMSTTLTIDYRTSGPLTVGP
ncbi:prepilin-type N-terminal cleavage/methylation domain-containing protein [Cellulomonas sp. KRMCY2]|uniref:prepilin-type N-terminal cleavage/methylation domain-containing protein n=1 Tax=Cellulomonas sp. KRMCY2 TaxID=1304865 RepID=UPI00045E7478|nr:prepilin-type N-terminal cleavage/methylation domain-containing protein [Cellulomonas sp. KRMCY2]